MEEEKAFCSTIYGVPTLTREEAEKLMRHNSKIDYEDKLFESLVVPSPDDDSLILMSKEAYRMYGYPVILEKYCEGDILAVSRSDINKKRYNQICEAICHIIPLCDRDYRIFEYAIRSGNLKKGVKIPAKYYGVACLSEKLYLQVSIAGDLGPLLTEI